MIRTVLFVILTMIAGLLPAGAQSQYSAKIVVNERVITGYDLAQRTAMLEVFGAGTASAGLAEQQLIDEALYYQVGQELSLDVSDEEIEGGMEEFAARGGLTAEQLVGILSTRGVSEDTYRQFVRSGLLWRQVIATRFAGTATISEQELDNATRAAAGTTGREFLLAEIVVPTGAQGEEATRALVDRLSRTIRGPAAFAAAARRHSASPTAARGGRLDWIPAGNLPANILAQVLSLETNQVTAPISLEGAFAIFQLRGTRASADQPAPQTSLSYTQVAIPTTLGDAARQRATARVLIDKSDTCLDLKANAEDMKLGRGTDHGGFQDELGQGILMELAKLDDGEASYYTTPGGTLAVLMLCSRTAVIEGQDREALREALFSQKVDTLGAGLLQEMKGDAIIRRP